MAQADVIREFLVSLGFRTDEKSLKKFTDGVEGATKAVSKLVVGIAGAALTVSAGVAAFAANMEALYFAAQKTGASATNLKAFEKAAVNFGAASGDALQSVQSLARWMRETPGSEGFLASLGVNTRKANGELKDTTELMVELGQALKDKPYTVARQYGSMLGIGEDTLRAMMNGDFSQELEKQQALLKDAGYEEATRKAHEFGVKLREIQTRIEAVGVTIGTYLIDVINKSGPIILPILDKIAEGWKNIFSWINAAGEALANSRFANAIGKGMAWIFDKLGIKDQVDSALTGSSSSQSDTGNKSPMAKGGADPMAFFMGLGWSKDQAAGIVANLHRESTMNPNAIGDGGKAYGLAQWHPDRQAAFAKWAGKDIRQSTAEEQMGFVNYELTQGQDVGARKAGMLLKASNNARQAGEIVSRHYERPLEALSEASSRGDSAVQIAQNTTINVNGGDASATGRAVASEQDRVNQNLARNMQLRYN
jgi:hypothetical protein